MPPTFLKKWTCDNFIPLLFGWRNSQSREGITARIFENNEKTNHFFEDDDEHTRFGELMENLFKAMNNPATKGASIYPAKYKVIPNEHFGIKGGYMVEVLWVQLTPNELWKQSLDTGVKQRVEFLEKTESFPHLQTIGENINKMVLLGYYPAQINLLADLCYWNVYQNHQIFQEFISKDK